MGGADRDIELGPVSSERGQICIDAAEGQGHLRLLARDFHSVERGSDGASVSSRDGLPAEPWGYTAGKGRGLPASSAPNWTVRPYIHWGYRDVLTAHQALSSLFYCHNETGNVITHLGGLAVFVSLFVRDLFSDTLPPHHRAVSCAYLGVAQYCMGSSAAFHLLGPISKKGYEFALRCDMTGIALVIISSFLIGIHYGYWCHERTGMQPHESLPCSYGRVHNDHLICELTCRAYLSRDRRDPLMHRDILALHTGLIPQLQCVGCLLRFLRRVCPCSTLSLVHLGRRAHQRTGSLRQAKANDAL